MLNLILIFIIGLCVGSFLNVLIYREAVGEQSTISKRQKAKGKKPPIYKWLPPWILGRSYCDHCKKQLTWYDNIPLLSYTVLAGRCRFCHKKISWQYPLVELLTGIEFVWIYFLIKSNLDLFSRFEGFYSFFSLILWIGIGACLLAILVADFKYQIIPDGAIIIGIIVTILKIFIDYRYTGMIDFSVFVSSFLAALFFITLIIFTQGKGMGWGDVKLGLLMGLILGWPKIILAIMTAFLTGAFAGVILIMVKKKGLKSKIAFGPFLILGTLISLFYGQQIWFTFFP